MHNPTIPSDLVECYYLRDVVIPWMRQHPEQVDLESFSSCLAFQYLKQRYDVDSVARWTYESFGNFDFHLALKAHFNLASEGQSVNLFGASSSLEDRAALLDDIITEKVKELE